MATTPEVLQKRFGLPAELGTRDVPRILHAFEGECKGDRRRFLKAVIPAIMSGALKSEGEHIWVPADVTQAEMAERAGCTRETMTRRMSKIAEAAEGYQTAEMRAEHARKLRARAIERLDRHREECPQCQAQEPCNDAERMVKLIGAERDASHYERPQTTPILDRRRRVGIANTYRLNMRQRTEMWAIVESNTRTVINKFYDSTKAAASLDRMLAEAAVRGHSVSYEIEAVPVNQMDCPVCGGKDNCSKCHGTGTIASHYHYGELSQLLNDPATSAWFDPQFKYSGHKAMSRWYWDPRICDPETGRRLGTIPRLVMGCYEQMGLLEEWGQKGTDKHKPKGWLRILQGTVADYLGIDEGTVYRANCIWEKLGVLRIVSGKPRKTAAGIRRGPQEVLYLPMRMLTEAEAAKEKQRAEKRLREIIAKEGAQRLAQFKEMERLHGELLETWTGHEHCMTAFYREAARRLHKALIFPDLIEKYIPPTRAPDHPDCQQRT